MLSNSTNKIAVLFFSAFLLSACGEKTADDKREDLGVKFYDKLVEKKLYCEAEKIVRSRFEYASDYQTSDFIIRKRINEWQERGRNVELQCLQELWPKKEAELIILLANTKKKQENFNEARKVEVRLIPNSVERDELERNFIFSIRITNGSKLIVSGVEFDTTNSDSIEYSGEEINFSPTEGLAQGEQFKELLPGESRVVRINSSWVASNADLIKRLEKEVSMTIRIVSLANGDVIELFRQDRNEEELNFNKKINEINQILTKSNPNTNKIPTEFPKL